MFVETCAVVLVIIGIISIALNVGFTYFMVKHDKLRQLSIAGPVLLSTANDILNAALTPLFIIRLLGVFFTINSAKPALFMVSVDRLWALWRPLNYRQRSNRKFTIVASILSFSCGGFWLMCSVFEGDWSSTLLDSYDSCTFRQNFPMTSSGMGIFGLLLDSLIYAANLILLREIRKDPMIGASTNHQTELRRQRQRQMTISVLRVVLVHFILTTFPLAVAVYILVRTLLMPDDPPSQNMLLMTSLCITFAGYFEAMVNTIVYATKLPHCSKIIKKAFGFKVEESPR